MSINYKIKAEIVDIRRDEPKPSDKFLVDANVWYWMTYSRASLRISSPADYQLSTYPAYISRAIEVGAKVYRSAHTLIELSSVIEKAEAEIYRTDNGLQVLSTKEFRHLNDNVLMKFREEIDSVWSQIVSLTDCLEQNLSEDLCDKLLGITKTERLDSYDALMVILAQHVGINNIITDDGDYSTVQGIQVYTANHRVISAAQRSRKTLQR